MRSRKAGLPGDPFFALVRRTIDGDAPGVTRALRDNPGLARTAASSGATRAAPVPFFFERILHYVYEGDSALHMAAAAHQAGIAGRLIRRGADVAAENRRGAQPLHYAVDGGPGHPSWNPRGQRAVIRCLLEAGARLEAEDEGGVTPLHRAVRNRCSAAVAALLAAGADARRPNKAGSTPLHLAVQTTGRGGSGTPAARAEQRKILRLLIRHGARPEDRDGRGRTVRDCVRKGALPEWEELAGRA